MKTLPIRLILLSLFYISTLFFAVCVRAESYWQELVPTEIREMPPGVQKWYVLETDFLSRKVNTEMIYSPEQNDQLRAYTPEAKTAFDLVGYWIPAEEFQIYRNKMSPHLESQFFRQNKGKPEILFLVHPESVEAYPWIVNGAFDRETYRALATASSRSLLVWKPGAESTPFIAKVSLYKKIGHVVRSVLATETSYGVSVTSLLRKGGRLPKNAVFMDEVLGVIPDGMSEGGMILRTFPEEILTQSELTYAPLFSLYANDSDSPRGLLLEMIQSSDQDPRTFLREKIILPFLEIWKTLAVEHGLTIEPHAQNILVETKSGKLTGRFIFRDNGGFNVDEKFRKKVGLYVPTDFKKFGNLPTGNFGENHQLSLEESLSIYFANGFLFGLDEAVRRWVDKGWIQINPKKSSSLNKGWAEEILLNEIEKLTSGSTSGQGGYDQISRQVDKLRKKFYEKLQFPASFQCKDSFSN